MDLEQLKQENINLKKQVDFLQKKVEHYESPSPVRAYYVAQKMLNQQVDWLDSFDLKTQIGGNPKEDKIYDRSMDIYEKLTGNATKVNNLYIELNLSGDKEKDIKQRKALTAESVADAIGEKAGQKNNS
jgi:cell division septum initiation protein DivIVA